MNWLDRIRLNLARGLIKAAAMPVVPEWVRHSVIEPSIRNLIREGYEANSAVFACVSALAFSFPEPPLRVYDAQRQLIAAHPLRKLLVRPNPIMGEAELMAHTIVYAAIGGNAYWHVVRSGARRAVELWPYSAAHITPVPGGPSWIREYRYDPNGGGATDEGSTQPIDPADVVHFRWPTPNMRQPWLGMPPLRSVAANVDSDNEITKYLFSLLKNDAMPRTALMLPDHVTLTDDQHKRLKAEWQAEFGGNARGTLAILEGGATIQRLGLDLRELAFDALHNVPQRAIAAAFRVPLSVAGLGDDPTYSNSEEAYKRFTQSTLSPLWTLFADEVQSSLAIDFGDEIQCAFDTTLVPALREGQTQLWTRTQGAFTSRIIMLNEARSLLGLEAVAGGDTFFDPLAAPEPAPAQAAARPLLEGKATRVSTRAAALKVGARLQRLRASIALEMETDVDNWFGQLADRMVERLSKAPRHRAQVNLAAEDLVTGGDGDELEELLKYWYVELLKGSWGAWNGALGVRVSFDLTDPAVTKALELAGEQIDGIMDTTLDDVRKLLQHAADNGWSVDKIARGDGDQRGLRDIVQETYKNRGRTIARTELGTAQQTAASARYRAAGVSKVLVLDDGFDDSHPNCKILGNGGKGTVKSLEWAEANPLEHPNCVRAFAPWFDDMED